MSEWQEIQVKNDETWDRTGEIIGRYVQQQVGVGPNGSMIYTLEKEDGQKVGVWGSAVLDGKFSEIKIGSEVRIVPKGKAKSKKGVSYNDFAVFVKPGSCSDIDDPFAGLSADDAPMEDE